MGGLLGGAAGNYAMPGLPGALALGIATAATGIGLVGSLTWNQSKDKSDRLNRIIDGSPQPRAIARNSEEVGQYAILRHHGKIVTLHYFEAGVSNRHRGTLLLFHGFASNAYQWNRIFDELADEYHVIAVDLPGHGYSSCLKDHDYHFVKQLPHLMNAFMDQKDLRDVTLVGSSMGGGLSQLVAAGNHRIKQLILFCSSGCTGTIGKSPWFIKAAMTAPDLTRFPNIAHVLEKFATGLTLWANVHPHAETIADHDIEQFALPYRDSEKIKARAAYAKLIHRLTVELEPQADLLSLQKSIRQPTLIVQSEWDRAVPPEVLAALRRMIPHHTFFPIRRELYPQTGHAPMSDTPELAIKIIRDFTSGIV